MKKLNNPFVKIHDYHCFGCDPRNPIGLNLEFVDKGDFVETRWMPSKDYEGWVDVVHGGIQATIMDEIASWVVFVKIGRSGVTARLDARYKKAVLVSDGEIHITARLTSLVRNIATIDVELKQKEVIAATASIQYFVFSEDVSKDKFFYPGVEAF